MRDAVVSGEELVVEDFARIDAREVAGLGSGVEDLPERVAVDGEIVDGFVRGHGGVWDEGRLGEHVDDGAGVGGGQRFALILDNQPGSLRKLDQEGGGRELWSESCNSVE